MTFFRFLRTQFHTLRLRLALVTLVIGLVPFIVSAVAYLALYQENTLNAEQSSITAQTQMINSGIVSSGYLADQENDDINKALTTMRQIYGGRILVINGSLTVVKDTNGIDEGRTVIWENAIRALRGETVSYYDRTNHYLTVTIPVKSQKDPDAEPLGVLMVVRSMDFMEQNVENIRAASIIEFAILTVVILLLAGLISSRTIRPLKQMGDTLAKSSEGSMQMKLQVKDYQEAEDLANHFNAFLDRMRQVDDSRQEFVSNVSHELKTPLTSMKVLADSINSMDGAPVELYQEFMHDMSHEIDRETKIVNDLLSLVRMNKTGVTMNIAGINMNRLIEQILKYMRPIAERQQVEIVFESFRPVMCEIDETKFSLAITNLVENAIKYNNPGGWVHVTLNADHQYCYIRVADNGMGIPKDSLDRIFERFYRVDKSHSREIGGTGLGLAITQNAVRMHHGEIAVDSEPGHGTTFEVRLPLSYIPDPNEDVIAKRVEHDEAAEETEEVTRAEVAAEQKLHEAHQEIEQGEAEIQAEREATKNLTDAAEAANVPLQEEAPAAPEEEPAEDEIIDEDFPTEEEIDAMMKELDDEDDENA